MNFRNFEFLPLFWPKKGQNWRKMAILPQKWPKKGQNIKMSKIHPILFWGPLRSTLCPKISLFGQFVLELLHFSWFPGNWDFVTEMLIFARIWREMPYFLLKYVKPINTHIKTLFNTSKPLFYGKKAKNGSKIVKKSPKLQ